MRYFVLFDPAAAGLTPEELLWLAAANTDPAARRCGRRRDAQSTREANGPAMAAILRVSPTS
ncbi:MAG: hypothetical protein ACLRM8_10450 [Alistipes sp.]